MVTARVCLHMVVLQIRLPHAVLLVQEPNWQATGHKTEGVGLGLGGVGFDLGGVQGGQWIPKHPTPVFEVPPAMLVVDLSLGQGEERSCERRKHQVVGAWL